MAQGKQSPRQKMINLMYLVFIAMLAMQIDQEIIRSYRDTNQSLEDNRGLTESNNKIFLTTLEAKAKNSPDEFGPALEKYNNLKSKADALVGEMSGIKSEMSNEAGYDPKSDISDSFAALNNTEPSTQVFFIDGNEEKPSKKAADLKSKIEDFKAYIIKTFGSNKSMASVVARAKKNLVTDKLYETNKNWLQYKFYNQPLIAALSNLAVLQSDIRGIQSDALSVMLQEKVDADIKFDAFEAIVSGPTTVIQGTSAPVKVVIGNYASSVPGLNITGVSSVQNGQGFANLNTSSLGEHVFSGTITFNNAEGKPVSLPYNHTYNVIAGAEQVKLQSGALVSADKMNVLYRGLPNPVSGSILGADNTKTTLSASGASVSGGRGKWTVTPGGGSTVNLVISGKDPNGKTVTQSFPFRVKNIPPPVGMVQGKTIVNMPASSIPNQHVTVDMPDFDFPVSFSVNSFMFKVPGRAAMLVNGNSLSSVGNLTKNLRNGDIAYIFNINATATGLGGQSLKNIPAVIINVQ